MTTTLVHITPRFAPQIDGVGDYARLLATELQRTCGWQSRFVVGEPAWTQSLPGGALTQEFPAIAVARRDAAALGDAIADADAVLLHYVSYGFNARGVPWWVNRAIRRWKQSATPERPRTLVIVFHELWASGPPWRSEFYLGPIQKHLIRELHALADGCITSTPNMHRRLEALGPGKTTFAPIPSCVAPPALAQPHRHTGGPVTLIIFGQEASRKLTVETHASLIRALHEAGLLKELRAVGRGCTAGPVPSADVAALLKFLPAHTITTHRDLPPDALAAQLAGADLFLTYYPSAFLCKSSALTAAMACGCPPILPETNQAEPLVPGREVLACDGSNMAIERIITSIQTGEIQHLSRAVRAWYDANASWERTTEAVAKHLPDRSRRAKPNRLE